MLRGTRLWRCRDTDRREGLVHISELRLTESRVQDEVQLGDEVTDRSLD
jgi:ribosomal protein S1